MTFSIVGYDPIEKEWGIAVQSKFLGVGSVVPWAKAGVGAVATQSYANTAYGPKGLELMAQGKTAQEVLEILIADDPEREMRQFGLIDADGNVTLLALLVRNAMIGQAGSQGFILLHKEIF